MFVGKERAQVTRADVMATNGVMHVIDAVLLPREGLDVVSAARKSEGATFADLVQRDAGKGGLAERLETTANLTVFVPSDEAFEKLDKSVMDELLENKDAREVSEGVGQRKIGSVEIIFYYFFFSFSLFFFSFLFF